MPIVAVVAVLAGIVGVGLVVHEVHLVEESPAFPIVGLGLGLVALIFLLKAMKD